MSVADARESKSGGPLMAKRVRLDNVDHQHLRVIDRAAGGQSVNQALVVPTEFEELQREYPILFRKDENGEFQSVAILGLDRGENLFLDDGSWISRYVPATLRRGPLFLAIGDREQDEPIIVVDLDDPRVSESEGEPLFLPHGGAAPFLQQAMEALRTVHEGLRLGQTMVALLLELDLIAPVEINIDLGDGTHYRLPDLFTIGAEQFAALPAADLERLNRAGVLAAAIHVRSSLGNINRLVELKAGKLAILTDA
jgi:hypothetical protein